MSWTPPRYGFNLGVGIVVIPYALSQGGWACLGLLVLLAIIFYYTGLLLQRCMSMDPHIKCYPDIGYLAFGPKGKIFISTFIYLQLFLLDIGFLILAGDSLAKLFPNFGYKIGGWKIEGSKAFVILSAMVVLPTTWLKSLGRLAYVSATGVFACVVVIGAVIWVGLFGGIGFHEKGKPLNLSGIPMAASIYALCFNGHGVLPTIIGSMKDRSKGPKVLTISFITCAVAYTLMSILSYLMFGGQIKSQITLNLPVKNFSSKIAIYVVVILPLSKYALAMTPVAAAIEEIFPLCKKSVVSLSLRTLMVAITIIIALTFPFFGSMMAFIGSFLGSTIALILPCICYLKIFEGTKSCRVEKVIVMGILMLGFCIATLGTYFNVKRIVQQM
ncbi:hypothetical protein AMTR_s00029p00075260 [Amborella trichopoda]|uniref:Amino acid transporter transmembrane domain-containing protein n=1 Tax=Amborella trichopoda TaxID=13333 RepID=W1PN00_AMBTC|nr:hypothetical protein AMTR_s00029p00075260 [Amborella trichopoda]